MRGSPDAFGFRDHSRKRQLPATIIEHLRQCYPEILEASLATSVRLSREDTRSGGAFEGEIRPLLDKKIDEFLSGFAVKHCLSREEVRQRVLEHPSQDLKQLIEGTSLLHDLLSNWYLAGKQIFHILPDLIGRLIDTAVKAPAELVRLPFRSVMLVYDDERAFEAFESNPDKSAGALNVIVSEIEVEGERRLTFGAARSKGRRMSPQIYGSLLLRDGWTTEDAMTTDRQKISGIENQAECESANLERSLSRLVLNTVLYLGSASARVSGHRRNDPATHKDTHNFSYLQHQRVGDGITYLQYGPSAAANVAAQNNVSRRLANRHLVMGHWKSQSYGLNRSARRPVWIEPYARGPEAAEAIERAYVVR